MSGFSLSPPPTNPSTPPPERGTYLLKVARPSLIRLIPKSQLLYLPTREARV